MEIISWYFNIKIKLKYQIKFIDINSFFKTATEFGSTYYGIKKGLVNGFFVDILAKNFKNMLYQNVQFKYEIKLLKKRLKRIIIYYFINEIV